MYIPERRRSPEKPLYKVASTNRRRLALLIVIIFVIILSFFAGRYSWHTPYSNQDATSSQATTPSDKEGVPPDSLHH